VPGQSKAHVATGAALIDLGVVRGAYGVKGWIKITPFSTDADTLMRSRQWWLRTEGVSPRLLEVESARKHSGNIVAKWVDFDVPEQCEALKGSTVAVDRSAFPPLAEGEAYWVDLVGARVVNRAGVLLGQVQGVLSNSAQDLMTVKTEAGAVMLIPMVAEYVDSIDAKVGMVRVDWEMDWS
jgi:16S rRNA processing protein RimM